MAAQLHFGTGDSIAFGTTGAGTSSTAVFTTSSISNIVVGDLLVAWIHNQANSSSDAITAPSGWTRYGAAIGTSSFANSRQSGFYYYAIKSQADITSLGTTQTWTFTVVGNRTACVIARATGIDLDNIEDSASTAFQGNSTNTSALTITGITTVKATTLLVGGLHHQNTAATNAASTTSFMSSFQEYRTSPTDSTIANTGGVMGYTYRTSAGATGNVGATFDGTTSANGGELVAFKAGAWSPPTQTITRPTIVGTPTSATSVSNVISFNIAKPSNIQDGDVLILTLSAQSVNVTSDFASSGWTRISQAFAARSSTNRLIAFYALPVPSAAALSATSFTFDSTDVSTGGRIAAEIFTVRGAELSNITSSISPYGTTSSQTVTVQPGTPLVDNDLLLVAYNAQFTSAIDYSIASGPSGMTLQTNLPTSTGAQSRTLLVVYQQDVEVGAIGSKSLTWAGLQSQTSGVAITIRGLGKADPNLGVALHYTSAQDTLSTAHLFYTSATDTISTPKEVRPVPTGYGTVSAMLSQTPFYIAHRGGSDDWPEMSLYAYTQSAFWGMGALEVSLGRSSDGIWFGLHDGTLDRTSGTTGFTASDHTWAEIQQYQITVKPANGPANPQPYMRLEEILAVYYSSHVIMVDPKNATAFMSELLDKLDAMPGTPTNKFIVKYYGVSTSVSTPARARGYKAWGYFYQTDSANFAAYQGNWDLLGMDYLADQATWNSILSYGKPVIGHTIPNLAAANTIIGYGASGMMVSGIQETVTRSPNPSG
jgi:glycerophosphoryl diester phosphodiesterase